ncbi:monovalent cation/H(+) antiporter subunit G [Sphingopyxis panaciterrulae]|uniref:Multicomponent K+:H+ antiporter subunit G n=1 Tax=Sphingopyxis panaciterrulae TaxID=462372 RepID=A0A7W9B3K3_9SPHN|nr:monovalent cation/H(+) antiporter subunit G [Sphingopyxis panaciterrulae]MBB5705603.1 multicomponent K+:H+ antiporter subunit G [Sphingopyxis panaciterrulae]
MIQAPDLPTWAAIIIALLVLGGSILTLVGALGLIRLPTFYARVHATTLGATAGMAAILLASMLCFSVLQTRPVVHEILIALFVTLTTPVTLILLARAAIYRDRSENAAQVPDAQGAKAEG